MASDFYEITKILEQLMVRTEILRQDITTLMSPDFDPDVSTFKTDFEHPEATFLFSPDALSTESQEITRKELMLGTCVSLLETANVLIEAQSELVKRNQYDPQMIRRCRTDDIAGFDDVMRLTLILNSDLRERNVIAEWGGKPLPQKLYFLKKQLDQAVMAPPQEFAHLPMQVLIEKIFQSRIDFAMLSAAQTLNRIVKLETAFQDAVHVKVALHRDRVMADHKGYLQHQLAIKTKDILESLPKIFGEEVAIRKFLGKIYEMGDDDYITSAFKVERYEPVSIKPLTQFTP